MVMSEQANGLGLLGCGAALILLPIAAPAQGGGLTPPIELVEVHAQAKTEGGEPEASTATDTLSTSNVTLDELLTEEELAWAQAAWAYFTSTGDAPPAEGAPPRPGLVPARAGAPIASAWSMGDQVAAIVLAHRLGLIDDRELDQRLTRLLAYLNNMPLAFGELPNRFYSTDTGAMLGEDFAEGQAGWSAVDTGRLLIWLRIAADRTPGVRSLHSATPWLA
jgi:hypothetical protein